MTTSPAKAQAAGTDGRAAMKQFTRALGAAIVILVVWRVTTVGLAEGYPASFWIS